MASNFAARANQAVMQSSPKWRLAIWLLLMLSASLWTLQLWQNGARVQSDILAMLPHLQQDKLTERALNQVEATLADQVYIALVAKDETTAISAAKLLMQKLEADLVARGKQGALTDIRSADIQLGEALGQFYFPHRFKLLTAPQAEALASQNIESLIEAATAQLYNAFSYANSNLLAQDPLLLFPANLLTLAPSSKVRASQGILLANQGDNVAAVVMAKGRESAFNPNAQLAQMTALTQGLDAVKQSYPDITVLKAGALFHALAATQTAKSEISILGLASLLGVIALVWLAFRSVMPLLLAIVTISSGLLLAVTFTLSVFGELHLLTLVFGTSLIGIAIDYSFHFLLRALKRYRAERKGHSGVYLPNGDARLYHQRFSLCRHRFSAVSRHAASRDFLRRRFTWGLSHPHSRLSTVSRQSLTRRLPPVSARGDLSFQSHSVIETIYHAVRHGHVCFGDTSLVSGWRNKVNRR